MSPPPQHEAWTSPPAPPKSRTMPSAPAPEVISLGCRLNIAESETIRALVAGRDMVVVNSCAVTNAAVKATRVAIRRAKRDRPGQGNSQC